MVYTGNISAQPSKLGKLAYGVTTVKRPEFFAEFEADHLRERPGCVPGRAGDGPLENSFDRRPCEQSTTDA